jgi:predicted kinase
MPDRNVHIQSQQSLLVMCGISCSGKSTTAKKLQEALDIDLVSTDMFRKHSDFNKTSLNRNPLERYVVYYNALRKAEELLQQGKDVIIDGTFTPSAFMSCMLSLPAL